MSDGQWQRLTRRGLIGAGVAAGGAAALSRLPKAAAKPSTGGGGGTRKVDAVVVGAGFAGLTTALRLMQAGKSVIVLEARDRVGGRVLNADIGGGEITERGGTFAGPTQDHFLKLASDFGVEKFDTYDTGDNVYVREGQRSTYSDTGPTGTAPPDPLLLPDITLVVTRLDQMSTEVPVDAPWNSASAAEWDGQTLESWVRQNSVTPQFRDELVPTATRPIFGAEPRELSLLFTLFYIAASGNEQNPGTFERNFNTRDGAQMWRFRGGTQLIALRVTQQLGDRVVLSSPVSQITQAKDRVTVESARMRVDAKQVVVAVPPTLAGRIAYNPALPFDRDQLTQRLPQGTLTKVTAVYDKAFWRDDGLTGQAVCTDGYVSATFDDSPESGTPGVIFGFVGGDRARSFVQLSDSDRRAAVLAQFAQFFGPAAANPTAYLETFWAAEAWSRGCPVGIAGPGLLTAYGPALRKPVGRIHWAGTETSTYWNGYMDGAVRSGERAAAEVLAQI
jgi:monoamine oxidase